jgi:hypothetical protein
MVEIIKSRRAARGTRALDFRMLVDQGKCDVNGLAAVLIRHARTLI